MTPLASLTGGAIGGTIVAALALVVCVAWFAWAVMVADYSWQGEAHFSRFAAPVVALLIIGTWWWGMAFTLSGDYHAWNLKNGTVEKISKRLISNGDGGMSERYVVVMHGQPYGIDDTRATLLKVGDRVSLRCKKDYQWGVPRTAHGWACQWNGAPS